MKACGVWVPAVILAMGCSSLFAGPSHTSNRVPQDVFDGMHESFRPEKARGVHAKYQWDLSGPNGGHWWIEVNDGKSRIGRGKIDKPDVIFVASDRTWVAVSDGKLSGTWAAITGRLKVRGSRALARKLGEMFP